MIAFKNSNQKKFFTDLDGIINHYKFPLKYHREIVRDCESRHYFFNNRIVGVWNEMSELRVANVKNVNDFKESFDRCVEGRRLSFVKLFGEYSCAASQLGIYCCQAEAPLVGFAKLYLGFAAVYYYYYYYYIQIIKKNFFNF